MDLFTAPAPPRRRLLTRAAVVSVLVHGAVVLMPASWLTAGRFGGGAQGSEGDPARLVSVFLTRGSDPPAALPDAPAPPPEIRAPEPAAKDPFSGELPALDGVFPAPAASAPTPPAATAATAAPAAAGGAPGEPGEGEDPAPDGRFRPPRLLVGALPLASEEARDLDVPEEIHVRLRVGTDGRVDRVELADPALDPRILERVRRAADAMRFVPARRGGEPVEAWFSMAFVVRE